MNQKVIAFTAFTFVTLLNLAVFAQKQLSTTFSIERNQTELFSKGSNGYVNYFYVPKATWQKDNTSFSASQVNGDISAVYEPQRKHSAVFYKGADSYLHYYYVENGTWQHDGGSFKNSKVDGNITVVYEPQRMHSSVFFRGADGYLHFYFVENGSWKHDGDSFKASKVDGNIAVVYEPQRQHCAVFFKGQDGYLHYYYVENGSWHHDGSSFKNSKIDGDITAVYETQRTHSSVFFRGTDGYLHFYHVDNGSWQYDDYSFKASKVDGNIVGIYEAQRQHCAVFFKGQDGYLHYYYVENGSWQHDGSSFISSKVDRDITAVFEKQRNHAAVFFKGSDGNLHYYYLNNGMWNHDAGILTTPTTAPYDGPLTTKRISGINHLDYFAHPDPGDGYNEQNGVLFVTHNPGCGVTGNEGHDIFFRSGKALPNGCKIERIDFQQFWPNCRIHTGWADPGTGDFDANQADLEKPYVTIFWHNACTGHYQKKNLYYRVSFIISMPVGLDLGENLFDPNISVSSSFLPPAGYELDEPKSECASTTTTPCSTLKTVPAYALNLVWNRATGPIIYFGTLPAPTNGCVGKLSKITNSNLYSVTIVSNGKPAVLNVGQSTTPADLKNLYGSENPALPVMINVHPSITLDPSVTNSIYITTSYTYLE